MCDRATLIALLEEHTYWAADELSDEVCSCGEWPRRWENGNPVPDWPTHVADAAEDGE